MSSNTIHPTALISNEAIIGENVEIGPFTIVGDRVKIGNNCKIHGHVILEGNLEIGDDNEFFQFCLYWCASARFDL